MGSLNDALQRERDIDLTRWKLVEGTTNEYERIPNWKSDEEHEAEVKENRRLMSEKDARSLLEVVAAAHQRTAKLWIEERKKNKELEAELEEARMDIASLERKIDSMRDTPMFNGNPD